MIASFSRTADVAISIISTGFQSSTYSAISENFLVGRLCKVFAKQVVGKFRCSTQASILSVSLNSCIVGERRPRFTWEHIWTLTRSKDLKDLVTFKNSSVSSTVDFGFCTFCG